jgi:hypothetical protein
VDGIGVRAAVHVVQQRRRCADGFTREVWHGRGLSWLGREQLLA